MVNRTMASALTVAALINCAIAIQSHASLLAPVIGQTAPSFSVPETVPQGTQVRVSSSAGAMGTISETLGKGFEGEYTNSTVEITSKDADAAIQDILNGTADLAAISRPLTDEEKAKGLVSVPVLREKIAIVIGANNPFSQSLSSNQFAQIFRGEIKDWSSVGGAAGPIRFIDRPESNETRLALKPYPVFATAEFKTGDNATQLSESSTAALTQALGTDGIGYALVGQIEGQAELKAIELHKTPPSDPRYPFSQPYAFVYNGGASTAATAFLGYATGNPGQTLLKGIDINGPSPLSNGAAGDSVAAASTGIVSGSEVNVSGSEADGSNTNSTIAQDNSDSNADSSAVENGINSSDANSSDTNSSNANGAGADGTNDVIATGNEAGRSRANGPKETTANSTGETIAGTATLNNAETTGENEGTTNDAVGIDGATGDGSVGKLTTDQGRWWWLLLPLTGLGLLIWAAGKRSNEENTSYMTNAGEDDQIRSNTFRSRDLRPEEHLDDVEGNPSSLAETMVGGNPGIEKVVVGSTALAGSAAAARSELTGNIKNKTGNTARNFNGIQDNVHRGSIDAMEDPTQGSIDSVKGTIQGNTGDWLERAKQRINEAAEQIKDSTAERKEDITQE